MSAVVLRCPNCGTTKAATGECDELAVRATMCPRIVRGHDERCAGRWTTWQDSMNQVWLCARESRCRIAESPRPARGEPEANDEHFIPPTDNIADSPG